MTIGVNQALPVTVASPAKTDKSGKAQGENSDFSSALDDTKSAKSSHERKDAVLEAEHETPRWSRGGGFGVKGSERGRDDAGKKDAEATVETDAGASNSQAKTAGTPLSALIAARELDIRTQNAESAEQATRSGTRPVIRGQMADGPDIKLDLDPASVAAAEHAARGKAGKAGTAHGKGAMTSGDMLAPGTQGDEAPVVGKDARSGTRMSSAATITLSLTPTSGQAGATVETTDPALTPGRDFLKALAANSNGTRPQGEGFGRRAASKPETVTVISQQNIPAPLAQPSASTVSALTNLIAADPAWRTAATTAPQAVGAQHGLSSAHSLKLQLQPAELGMVTANLRFSGDQLTVELHVDNAEAYRRLSSDSESIVKSLRSMGLRIDHVTVHQPQAANSAQGGADGNNAAAGFGQRDQQSFGSAGSGGSGGEPGSQHSARNDNESAYGSEGAAPAAANRSDGGVYI